MRTQNYYSQTRLHTARNVENLLENRAAHVSRKSKLFSSCHTRDSVRDSVRYLNNLQTSYVRRKAKQFSVSAFSKVCVARANATVPSNSHSFGVSRVPLTAVGFLLFLPLLVRHLRTCHAKKEVSVSCPLLGPVLQLQSSTFLLIVSTEPKGT